MPTTRPTRIGGFAATLTIMAAALTLTAASVAAGQGDTERVSVDGAGVQGDGLSFSPAVSADGRYVAFTSFAQNLVPGDTNNDLDVFVHDRSSEGTTRVGINSAGVQADSDSSQAAISADGRFVAFYSVATNLVAGDTNGLRDVFVHDTQTGDTTRVSVSSTGNQGNGESDGVAISANGRYVAFHSEASNLVPGDTNNFLDVFVHDRTTDETTRVSVDGAGVQGDSPSAAPSIARDGRYVAFFSLASNLVPGDGNGESDVFVHDRTTRATTLVSLNSAAIQADGRSSTPSISTDGRYIAFESDAPNLVANDTNDLLDVFVHDRTTGGTTRVSVDNAGAQANRVAKDPAISASGRYVAFVSGASNLVADDTNSTLDVFVHDTTTEITRRVSVHSDGGQGDAFSENVAISGNGRYVVFDSLATNLVPFDTNMVKDVFVHQNLPDPLLPTTTTTSTTTSSPTTTGTSSRTTSTPSPPPG